MAAPAETLQPVVIAHNLMTNAWWGVIFGLMGGNAGDTGPVVLSIGTGSGAINWNDTAMWTEWQRFLLQSQTFVAGTSTVAGAGTFSFFSPASDGAITMTEAGLFCNGATTTLVTGTMVSHLVFSYGRPANQDVRMDYTITRA